MHSQLGYTLTMWRWFIAIACVFTGATMLRNGDADRWVAPTFLLLGAGLIGLETYLRRSRTTLVLQNGNVDVLQRGVSLGSFPAEFVRHWDLSSRVRVLVKSLVVSFVCFFVFGAALLYSGDSRLGVTLLSVGVVFTVASIWEFRTLWEIALPKSDGGSTTIEVGKRDEAKPIVLTLPSSQRVILLRKPDVVKLLGFWPADTRNSSAGQR
jgi:hypothetical protein